MKKTGCCGSGSNERAAALIKLNNDSMAGHACTATIVAIALELIYHSKRPRSPPLYHLPRGRSAVASSATPFLVRRDAHPSLSLVSLFRSPDRRPHSVPATFKNSFPIKPQNRKTRKISHHVQCDGKRRSVLYIEIVFQKCYSFAALHAYTHVPIYNCAFFVPARTLGVLLYHVYRTRSRPSCATARTYANNDE